MKLPLCGLATEFLRNAIGASAVFLLLDSFVTVGSAEGPTGVQARSAEGRSNAALTSSSQSVHVATAMRGGRWK
jgi:hypothetical protein